MKLRTSVTLALILLTSILHSQPVTYSWSTAMGGKGTNDGQLGLAKDDSGNIYIIGQFAGMRTFDGFTLTALGSSDVFVAKYNVSGTCVWAIRGGASFAQAFAGGITVNGSNVFITGSFTNLLNFGGSCVLASVSGYKDVFFASLNSSDGSCNWLESGGGNYDDFGVSITNATGGGFYVTGTYIEAATFGTFNLTTSSSLDANVFYAKYTAAGTCAWAKQLGGLGTDVAGGIKEVSSNVIVMNGGFEDVMEAPTGVFMTSYGFQDVFVVAFNTNGNLYWARQGGGIQTDLAFAIDTDNAGNIYSTGIIGGDVTFGSVFAVNQQNLNMFITKHNSNGVCQWIRQAGNINDDMGLDLATDPSSGSTYVTGYMNGNGMFGTTPFTGAIGNESYVVKYTNSGTLLWLSRIGDAGTERGKAIIFDAAGSCFTAGEFDANMALGANPPISPSSTGITTVYLTKINGGTLGVSETDHDVFSLYPNPATDAVTLNLEKITDHLFTIEIFDTEGKSVKMIQVSRQDATRDYRLSLSKLSRGSYFIRVYTSQGEFSRGLVVW